MLTAFPKWTNRLPFCILFAGGGGFFGVVGFVWYYFSPEFTDVGYAPPQPVPYSHKLHAGTLGMDCRYCHTGVEVGSHANVPPSQTCMNCHTEIKPESQKLLPVRESFDTDQPVQWKRIHKLPDFVRFNHSIHINAGVGCVSCHGRIDQMEVVRLSKPLSMGWCLNCHRDPESRIRPRDKVTVMDYLPTDPQEGARLVQERDINPPENCSACHY